MVTETREEDLDSSMKGNTTNREGNKYGSYHFMAKPGNKKPVVAPCKLLLVREASLWMHSLTRGLFSRILSTTWFSAKLHSIEGEVQK